MPGTPETTAPRGRRRAIELLVGLLLAVGVHPSRAAPEVEGLELVGRQTISAREIDLTFRTPALAERTKVRVILPAYYDPSAATRYPVLYLLHGGAGQYTDWATAGRVVELTADLPLIIVLPDGGRSAWYTDWYNNGLEGQPMWETYHLRQLVPWIDANFATFGDRAGRAIAGLSSGGFGAMSYASRHPDLFVAGAAFSGAVDTNTPPVVSGKVIDGLAAQDGGGPGSLFGLRETEEVRWRGHNPWDLASNLRDMSVTLRTGNGMAGGQFGGGGPTDPGGLSLERSCHDMSVSLHERLGTLGIDHVWDDYGPGTHNYDYWSDALARTLPTFMEVLAARRPDPSSFSYRAIEDAYDIYGWRVEMDRPVTEFSSIDDVTADGFSMSGSGTASVTTAPLYEPNRSYLVTTKGEGIDEQTEVRADDRGRLALVVPLGPANLVQQQFTPTHESPATRVYRTTVRVGVRA